MATCVPLYAYSEFLSLGRRSNVIIICHSSPLAPVANRQDIVDGPPSSELYCALPTYVVREGHVDDANALVFLPD